MPTSSEPIEAEATIIEEEIAPITGLDALIGEITHEAADLAAEFLPHEIKDEDDFKQSKRERTAARKGIARLKAKYADKMGAIKDAVAEADLRMKAAIDPLDSIDKGYKVKVDEYTTRWTNNRIATLREAYEDFAPDLALPQDGADEALVPFHRLLGRYGNKKGEAWTTRTVGEVRATEAMYAAVEEIAKAEKTIDSMVEEEWREGAKARYFRTLDLQATLNEEAEAKAQRERVARLEAERQARIAEEEAARRRAEEDAWLEDMAAEQVPEDVVRVVAPPAHAEAVDSVPAAMPPEPAQETAEEPAVPTEPPVASPILPTSHLMAGYIPTPQSYLATDSFPPPAPPLPRRDEGYAEATHPWVIFIPSATKTQMLELRDWLNARGLTGGKVYSGNVRDAYQKELRNANRQ